MWETFLVALSQVTLSRGARDDDAVDQLHHVGTVALLTVFALLIGMTQYVGEPIQCWMPAQFTNSHKDYTQNLCWISHMYYVPMDQVIPYRKEDRMLRNISFYRWVVVMLLIQCLLFKFPNLLWKELKGYSGINVQKIVSMAEQATSTSPEEREQKVKDLSQFIDRWLQTYRIYKYNILIRVQEKLSGVVCFMFGKRHGTYLTGLYLFIKFLYLVNVICQFKLLTTFLGFNFYMYGFEVISSLNDHGEFRDIEHFPRVVMCDIEIRQQQNVHTFSTQCVLSINLFVEKIFAVIWFWLFVLMVATLVNAGRWVYDIMFHSRRERFVKKYLIMLGLQDSEKDRKLFRKCVATYLRDDGIFLLQSIGTNSSDIILLDIVRDLWTNFKIKQTKRTPVCVTEKDTRN